MRTRFENLRGASPPPNPPVAKIPWLDRRESDRSNGPTTEESRDAQAGPAAARREHLEPREPVHGLDRRGPLAEGRRGGDGRGEAAARGRLRLRRGPHL